MLAAVNDAQKVLENTYIRQSQRDSMRLHNFNLNSTDLDRSDMGCIKKTLLQFMKSCHIEELMQNNY